jgi:hypothetical protein
MLRQFKDYYRKAKMNQERLYQGLDWSKEDINDDLIWHIPIYDVVNRRFAVFSSLLEAMWHMEEDPKGNWAHFNNLYKKMDDQDFVKKSYLFRLCGSGINYKPKERASAPFGTHGFGNFWVVNHLREGRDTHEHWLNEIPEKGFCDVKGYLLPMIKGGLRNFITGDANLLLDELIAYVFSGHKVGIKNVVDFGNNWLIANGYKRQNFVLTAFAMDMAEYFPENVDRNSDVYAGSNAKKCLKLILPKMKIDDALRHLCDITGGHSKPYDMEDVACDFIRYIENFQSADHIRFNNNVKYFNNVLK